MKLKTTFYLLFLATSLMGLSLGLSSCFKSMARSGHDSSISDEQFQRLKNQTVVFVLPVSEYEYVDDYKELLSSAWTLTPIEVIKYSELPNYSDASRYALFSIHGLETTVKQTNGFSYKNTHYYLSLTSGYVKSRKGKNKVVADKLCRVELYPDFGTTDYSFSKKDVMEVVYTKASMRNFSLPYMLAYLKFVQKNVLNKKNLWVYENFNDANLKSKLSRDTLYVPENLIYDRNKFTGKETKKNENFFDTYPGKYKIVSNKELMELVKKRDKKKPFFLFEYVLSSTDKYVGVLDVGSGTVVYRKYTPITYNLKSKDIEKILN